MNKAMVISSCLWASILVFVIVSCSTRITFLESTQQPLSGNSKYVHYIPSQASQIHLEFDYLRAWSLSEKKIDDTDSTVVVLNDPRFQFLPTRSPDESHGIPNDLGSISILVGPAESAQFVDARVQQYIQIRGGIISMKALKNYKTTIDGHDAWVLEYQIKDQELYTSIMFERSIFLFFNAQSYQITFLIAENERDSEFEQDYHYFLNSIQTTP